jgi:hypothetical protein
VALLKDLEPDRDPFSRHYMAYGLAILSSIPLPELSMLDGTESAQVRICAGPVAPRLEGRTGGGALYEVAPDKFLLCLDGVARYLVSGGAVITIDRAPGGDEDAVRLFLLGSVFGALLHQRGLVPLHASAIETPKGAVLFAGGSGSGKSAVAAAFHTRGYRVIADEICAINGGFPTAEVVPAIPRLLLWPDIIEQVGSPAVCPVRVNLKKYHMPLETGFATHPSPIHALYILKGTNARECEISRAAGIEKFQELVDLTFRRQFLSGMCPEIAYFNRVAGLAREVSISRFWRPSSQTLPETADLLERDFSR